MILYWILLLCADAFVFMQDALPGKSLYHTGWYNVITIAALVLAAWRLRALSERKPSLLIAFFGSLLIVVAGAAAGLMGPQTQTVVGAPGATVRSADIGGSFVFPMAANGPIVIVAGNTHATLGGTARYSGGLIAWRRPRTVVRLTAADAAGNTLTITQPTNATFLSPVLLMQSQTSIDGMQVAFDSFALPAVQRDVRAVLFSAQQVAQLHTALAGEPAVLFAVSDDADRVVPGGIGIVPSGGNKRIGMLRLGADVETYPAVVVASAPYLPVLLLGLLVLLVGIVRTSLRSPSRS